MNLETVVCIKTSFIDYTTATYRFTKDQKYSLMDDSKQSIQIIDNYGKGIAMDRSLFDAHFKYLSDMREEKLKEIGI
jgi:hypothetical protein